MERFEVGLHFFVCLRRARHSEVIGIIRNSKSNNDRMQAFSYSKLSLS